MKIAILGCGPAGLLAAHAAALDGHHEINIFSRKVKTEFNGAIYMHRSIPGLTSEQPDDEIHVFKRGEARTYAQKVYGDPEHPVSWSRIEEGVQPIWYMQRAYDELWDNWEVDIRDRELGRFALGDLTYTYDLVVNTIPRNVFCMGSRHVFESQSIMIARMPQRKADEASVNVMIYNGTDVEPWYRFSDINGLPGYEFSHRSAPEALTLPYGAEVVHGYKPTYTNCTCWEHPRLMHLGRFGEWDKQVLSHHAFEKMQARLAEVPHVV